MCDVLALHVRQRRRDFERAFAIQREAQALMADNEDDIDSFDVLELARDSGCTAFDCEFIALARRLETELFAQDAKLRKAFPKLTAALSRA